VTDEHPARAEPVPARAVLRWPNHPSTISAADELADCGHNAKPRCRSAVRLWRCRVGGRRRLAVLKKYCHRRGRIRI
jgi:hypothetical protein